MSSVRNQNLRVNCKPCTVKISRHEIIFIICVTVLCCGVEFGYDIPGSLQVYLMDNINYGLTSSQYSLLYSLYALPNIFICFFGGFLIDSALGIKTSTVLYMLIAAVGSSLFAAGGYIDTFWLMLLGRLMFGLGTEMGSSVCLNYLTFTRFKNTNMNLVFSISDNYGYIGSIAAYQLSYRLYDFFHFKEEYSEKMSLKIVLIITSCIFLISSVSGILMTYLNSGETMTAVPVDEPQVKEEEKEQKKAVELKDIIELFKTLTKFPLTFWLLCLTSAYFGNAIYTFENFQQGMLKEEYGLEADEAGDLNTALSITKIIFSIPLSMMVDRVGRNTAFVLLAVATGIVSHCLFLFKIDPQICMCLLGLSYTIMGSSIVPMYAYLLSKKHCGLCYGIVTSISNLSLSLCPMIAGKLIDNYGYKSTEIFYLISLAMGLICIIMVWVLDNRAEGILMMTPTQRMEREQRIENNSKTENEV